MGLQSIPASGVKPIPDLKHLEGGCKLLHEFLVPDADPNDVAKQLLAIVKFAQDLQRVCSLGHANADGPVPAACVAMAKWCDAAKNICNGKAMQLILENPNPGSSKPWDYKNMLNPSLQGFASSLQCTADIKDKINKFKEDPDLEGILKELPTFETVSSCFGMKIHESDPMCLGWVVSSVLRFVAFCWV